MIYPIFQGHLHGPRIRQGDHGMSKVNMQKRSRWNIGIFSLSLSLIAGCSAFHKVSVVSQGDEVASVEDAVLEPTSVSSPPPIVLDSTFSQSERIEKAPIPPVPPSTTPVPLFPPTSPSFGTTSLGEAILGQSATDPTLPWTLEDVFFDFDQIEIRPDAIPHLAQNAKVLLKRYAHQEVLIQGHCDERGTEEYNLILGDRRAMAVKNYLIDLGVVASQLRVLSLGKNQPFCLERTISCFQQNRRAHFVLE